MCAMELDSFFCDIQLCRRLFVQKARGDQRKYFPLPSRELLESAAKFITFGALMVECLAAVDCQLDGLEKHNVVDRLLKKVDGTAFHRANTRSYFAKPREKYDGQRRRQVRQTLLNLEAANTWKIQI